MSGWWLRSPAALMTAYVGLYLYAGPWVALGSAPAHRNALEFVIAVVLAVLAARGSRAARVLMITFSILGVLTMLFGSTSWWSTGAVASRAEYFVCYLVQICLLLSTPMYQRTRAGWSPAWRPPTQFLPAPRLSIILASAAAGFIITLLPFAGLRALPCRPGHPAAHWGPCLAQGTGYPIAYRFGGGIFQIRGGNVHWLFVFAPQGIQPVEFAADWAMWSLGVLLAFYLAWLERRREYATSEVWSAVPPPTPASP
jgi:hypothetical protein